MTSVRLLLAALLALCLTAFPVGTSRALAPVGQAGTAVEAVGPHDHVHHGAGQIDPDIRSADAQLADHHDTGCGEHAKSTAPCCGFGCHMLAPLDPVMRAVSLRRAQIRFPSRDEQVGGGLPFSIERPPRLG